MMGLLQRLLGKAEAPTAPGRTRRLVQKVPETIYAIGDIHGCLAELKRLEARIVEDALNRGGEKWVIYLGDYVDRGPSSAAVIDHLLAPPPPGFQRICLAGNHEEMFLEFVAGGSRNMAWLGAGGEETLASYGVYLAGHKPSELPMQVRSCVPDEHIDFLRSLPSMVQIGRYCFVHAGIDPKVSLRDQQEKTLLWSRPHQFEWPEQDMGLTVVHGHTPVSQVELSLNRINVDIGAYIGGILAAVRITANEIDILLSD